MAKKEKTSFIISPVELPNGDMMIDIPKPILKKLGWVEGDQIDIEPKDGKIYMKKVEN